MFWSIAILMLLSAITFVLYPLLSHQTETTVYSSPPQPQSNLMLSALLVFLIPVAVLSIYINIGDPDASMKTVTADFVLSADIKQQEQSQQAVADVATLFERLKQRLEQQPDDGDGWKMMGLSYLHFKQYEQALKAYQRAAELLPDDLSIQQSIQRVTLELQSASQQKKQTSVILTSADGQQVDVGAMVARLEKKLENNPDNLPGWMMLGRSYSHLGQHQKAIDAYQNALILQPNSEPIQKAISDEKTALSKM